MSQAYKNKSTLGISLRMFNLYAPQIGRCTIHIYHVERKGDVITMRTIDATLEDPLFAADAGGNLEALKKALDDGPFCFLLFRPKIEYY